MYKYNHGSKMQKKREKKKMARNKTLRKRLVKAEARADHYYNMLKAQAEANEKMGQFQPEEEDPEIKEGVIL